MKLLYILILSFFICCAPESNQFAVSDLPGKASYVDKLGVSMYLPTEYISAKPVDYFKLIERSFSDSSNREHIQKAIQKFSEMKTVAMFYDTSFVGNSVFLLKYDQHIDFNKRDGEILAGYIEENFQREKEYSYENIERSIKSNNSIKYLKYKYVIDNPFIRYTSTYYVISSKSNSIIVAWHNFRFEDTEPYIQRTKFYVTN